MNNMLSVGGSIIESQNRLGDTTCLYIIDSKLHAFCPTGRDLREIKDRRYEHLNVE